MEIKVLLVLISLMVTNINCLKKNKKTTAEVCVKVEIDDDNKLKVLDQIASLATASQKGDIPIKFDCPFPYEKLTNACIHVRQHDPATTWLEGREVCKNEGGPSYDLATYKDANEFHEIIQYLRKVVKQPYQKPPYLWIGGRDVHKNGIWSFIDGSKMPMGAPFWGPSQPNNAGEDCACLYPWEKFYQHDVFCNRKDTGYPICYRRF